MWRFSRKQSDGNGLLDQMLSPLKPENGLEGSVKFVNGAYEAVVLWEMVVSHVETVEEELAKVHIGSE